MYSFIYSHDSFQNLFDEEYNPDRERVVVTVKGDTQTESESDSTGEGDVEGSEIETPSEEEVEVQPEKSESTKRQKTLNLIGPPLSNVPYRYYGNHGYLKYIRSVLKRVRGDGVGVSYHDWVPHVSDWDPTPERYVCTKRVKFYMLTVFL